MPPGEDGPWERAGKLLIQRRTDMDPRYRNRRLFAEERGVNWRLLHDIERAKRTNFEPETLAAIESAYRLAPGNIGRMLAGGGLEPLSAPSDSLPRPPDAPRIAADLEQARPEGTPGTWISPASVARADQVFMPAIRERLAELAEEGIADPDGSELFPDNPGLAGAYDGDRLSGSDVYSAAWMAALVAERNDRLGGRGRGPRQGSAGA